MDLCFEPTTGRPFTMEVGYFDTILEIKEKIQKYHKIPVQKQTLIFNNQILPDDLDIHPTDLVDNSRIKVIISGDLTATEKPTAAIKLKQELSPPPATPPPPAMPSKKIQLHLKMPNPTKLRMAMELEANDSIRKLKEKINEVEGIPVGKIIIHANGIELHDHNTLHEYGLLDHSEIDVSFRHYSPASSLNVTTNTTTMNNNNSNNNPKKLKIVVETVCGTKKIAVEVNPSDNVSELRKELKKVNQRVQLHLPPEGFFFIYKQNVMEEDRSFRWHRVGQGDTIDIFSGSISGGS